jgi:arsenite methyltransferase
MSFLGIEPGMIVADFGTGSGAYALAVGEALTGSGKVYAVDVQKDLLRRLANEAVQKKITNVEIIWADLEMSHASKLADQSVDVVIISNLLFQLVDKMPPLREAHRILKKTGRLALIDWNDSYRGLGPASEDIVTKDAAVAYATRAHLALQKEFVPGVHHYGLILKPAH